MNGDSCPICGGDGRITNSFGGSSATSVTVVNTTTITCDTPAHAGGAVDVVVTNDFGSDTLRDAFTYHDAPQISGISPDSGPVTGGTAVTHEPSVNIIAALCQELAAVARAKGIALDFDDPVAYVRNFGQKIPNARPSMLLDHMAGRKAEIEVTDADLGRRLSVIQHLCLYFFTAWRST